MKGAVEKAASERGNSCLMALTGQRASLSQADFVGTRVGLGLAPSANIERVQKKRQRGKLLRCIKL